MIKRVVLLLFTGLTILSLSGCSREPKEYEVAIEFGDPYTFDATEIFGCSSKDAAKYEADLSSLDLTKVGQYDVEVKKGRKEYIIHFTVEDTKAPIVDLNTKYVFSNQIENIDLTGFAEIKDPSSYTEKLCKFQKVDAAKTLDEVAIKEYTDALGESNTEELLRRPDNTPMRDGVYTAVYLVEDAYGHKTAKEVVVIYDTATAVVSGLEELNKEIEVDDVNVKYTDDLLDNLTIVDAFDGTITKDMLIHTMEQKDTNIYTVKAEYTDRASNKTFIEYEITLKEKKKEIFLESVVEVDIESSDTESEDSSDVSHYIPIPEEWNLIVVNKWNMIPENYSVELTELSNGQKVDSRIYISLQQMFEAAAAEGLQLMVREGYRTAEEQQNILDEKIQSYIEQGYSQQLAEKKAKNWVAIPGTSEHELGIAVDINADLSDDYNKAVYEWLAENAHEYGFILRYPKGKRDITGMEHEPWHYRYVGVEAAQEIYERGICLEEYLTQ